MKRAWASTLAVAAVMAVALAVGYRLLGAAAGPEAELLAEMERAESKGLKLSVPGSVAPLSSRTLHFDRLSVHLDPNGGASVVGTLDFQGFIGGTEVSSIGLEKIPFLYRQGQWQPSSGWAPQLTAVVAVLELRQRAQQGTREAYHPKSWYIRIERDQAVVTEDFQPQLGPAMTVGEGVRSRRLNLARRGTEFSLGDGA